MYRSTCTVKFLWSTATSSDLSVICSDEFPPKSIMSRAVIDVEGTEALRLSPQRSGRIKFHCNYGDLVPGQCNCKTPKTGQDRGFIDEANLIQHMAIVHGIAVTVLPPPALAPVQAPAQASVRVPVRDPAPVLVQARASTPVLKTPVKGEKKVARVPNVEEKIDILTWYPAGR